MYKNMLVFEKPGCRHCARARACLRKNGLLFTSIKCKDIEELKLKLNKNTLRIPQTLTFPRIYDGKKLLGGADDIEKRYGA
jgi:glutaredoxin